MSYYYQNINHYKRIIRRNPLYTKDEAREYVAEYMKKEEPRVRNYIYINLLFMLCLQKEYSTSGSKVIRLQKSITLDSRRKHEKNI